MARPTVRVKVQPRSRVRVATIPKFPAQIVAGDGVAIEQSGGVYTFSSTVSVGGDLTSIEGLTGTGILTRTADESWALRTLTGTSAEITVTNGNGVLGNPTISLPTALTFTGKTITGGTYSGVAGITITPTAASTNKGFTVTQTGPTMGSTQGELRFNEINVTSAVKVLPGSPSSTQAPYADHVAAALKVTLTEGANAGGFQIAQLVRLNHTVATDIWDGSAASDHIVFAAQAFSNAADAAIGGEGAGIYSGSFALHLQSGAVHQHVVALNPEIISESGITIQNRVGVRAQSMGTSGARGADLDAAYTIVAVTNSWKDGIVFGEPNAFTVTPPLHTSGSLMRSESTMTVTDGFELSNVTFTGNLFNFPRGKLTGAGVLTLNPNSVAIGSVPTPPAGVGLHLVGVNSTTAAIEIGTFGSGAAAFPEFRGQRSRGTAASRTAAQSGDVLVVVGGGGFDGTNYSASQVGIAAFASENYTTGGHGSNMTFFTTPTGSTTTVTRGRVNDAGLWTLTQNSLAIGSVPAPFAGTLLQVTAVDGGILPSIQLEGFGSAGSEVPTFRGVRSRGTAASRAAVQTDDALAAFGGGGFDSSAYSSVQAGITAFASQTWTGSAHGAYLALFTTPAGSTTAVTRTRISTTGVLTQSANATAIGSLSAPDTGAIIHGVNADAAITRLSLDTYGNAQGSAVT